jgi:hypothetical protein
LKEWISLFLGDGRCGRKHPSQGKDEDSKDIFHGILGFAPSENY